MATYNRWQNQNLYGAAERASDEQRKQSRGAFFGSIHATLNHLLWADQIWMSRFVGSAAPTAKGIKESVVQYDSWDELRKTREAFDQTIVVWAEGLEANWLRGDLTYYSAAVGREMTKPRWLLVTHMFNHQTHHRGQVHCMLTQCDVQPGDTDLPLM